MSVEPEVTGPQPLTVDGVTKWLPLLAAALVFVGGIATAWGVASAEAASNGRRITTLEQRNVTDEQWRDGVDQRLTAIVCKLIPDKCPVNK